MQRIIEYTLVFVMCGLAFNGLVFLPYTIALVKELINERKRSAKLFSKGKQDE